MTLKEFFQELETHDWYYAWSDDSRVYRSGSANEERLRKEALTDPVKARMIDDWSKHMFNGEAWSTVQPPRPKLNDYEGA